MKGKGQGKGREEEGTKEEGKIPGSTPDYAA